MGTRSTTKIYSDKNCILSLYKQFDGSPEAWGQDLKSFIESGKFVNGISGAASDMRIFNGVECFAEAWGQDLKSFIESGKFVNGISGAASDLRIFNGVECFALQLVCHFKDGPGGLYATTEDDEQEYNYVLTAEENSLTLKCNEDRKFKKVYSIKPHQLQG